MGRMKHEHHETITRRPKGYNHAAEEHAAKEKARLENLAHKKFMDQAVKIQERAEEIRRPLLERGMPFVQAVVVSNDAAHAEHLTQSMREEGTDPLEIVWQVGSYARFAWAREHLSEDDFFDLLPSLWISSDPDDSTEMLELWKGAFKREGQIICDGEPLGVGEFAIYRGQLGDELGISWTLSPDIAKRFAKSGGMRTPVAGGKIIVGVVHSDKILAYLSGRDEYEVIVDPKDVEVVG